MMTTTPFVVFGSPRGRTFWLSRYLSYRDWACDHEMSRYIRSLADIKSWFRQPCVGTVETAAAAFWRLLPENVRVEAVKRLALLRNFAPEMAQKVTLVLHKRGLDRLEFERGGEAELETGVLPT